MPCSTEEPHQSGSCAAKPGHWDRRFLAALGAYGFLALMAGLTLSGVLRMAVWAVLGGLAIKTFLVWRRLR